MPGEKPTPTKLVVEGEEGVLVQWKVIRVGDTTSSDLAAADERESPPAPVPAPLPAPLPALPPSVSSIRGPRIAAASDTTYYGYITIMFTSFGGCDRVTSFIVQYGSAIADVPARDSLETVGVGLILPSYGVNAISAVALCSDGSHSERSNVVEVTNVIQGISEPTSPPPTCSNPNFYWAPNGITLLCPAASQGETGTYDGVTYTKRGYGDLLGLVGTVYEAELSTSCTTGLTALTNMFFMKSSFNRDVSIWDTSQVTLMVNTFYGATSFNQNINSWSTSAVTHMVNTFYGASSFNKPLDQWDTSMTTTMINVFFGASAFNQNIASWDTRQVTNMVGMFHGASAFNQNIARWRTDRVINMVEMFKSASSFNWDLSSWQVGLVGSCSGFASGATSWTSQKPPLTCAM